MTTLKLLREFPEKDALLRKSVKQGDKIKSTAGNIHPVIAVHQHHIEVPHPKKSGQTYPIPFTQVAQHIPQ
jgi:hypothetical protein